MLPTVILVHGAFAESSSWNGVIAHLHRDGVRSVAAANPLRGVADDARQISDLIRTIDGPVVLVGHSYGGAVISSVAGDAGDIISLVYVGAFAPEAGESAIELSQRFPGSTLGDALAPVPHADGTADLLIARDRFHAQFCADVPEHDAALMAATQRPVAQAALEEQSGPDPLWKRVPSYFVIGEEDRNIPAALQRSLAERAGSRRTVEIAGASHAVAVSHPAQTAGLILEAARVGAAA
ncbi:alpha/beta fold hydrolase [Baekduia sp. Peel2402]|uniref:alpha/beta fold hydrolase n=1 Tax=Baekduia sp. Peel2402 TaxID=3458296 RepID=UPI00403E5EEB